MVKEKNEVFSAYLILKSQRFFSNREGMQMIKDIQERVALEKPYKKYVDYLNNTLIFRSNFSIRLSTCLQVVEDYRLDSNQQELKLLDMK